MRPLPLFFTYAFSSFSLSQIHLCLGLKTIKYPPFLFRFRPTSILLPFFHLDSMFSVGMSFDYSPLFATKF